LNFPAKWWQPVGKGKVLCRLCPRFCRIGDGQDGFCFVRRNEGGRLFLSTYGRVVGLGVDPIEKKPFNHFLPGTPILSFGTAGCNLGCRFCQNWHMSRAKADELRAVDASPEQIVALAKRYNCPGIAYTYNEPTIYAEFLIDTARLARENGLRNVMVTNGYVTPEARPELYRYVDAANVDLKGFTDRFYHKLSSAHLADVLDTIKWLASETDVWIEITNLVIPGYNDDMDEIGRMVDWILENCGAGVPLHFSAFHPDYRLLDAPRTPPEMLIAARRLALDKGVRFVYTGNIFADEAQNTYCPECGRLLIERSWHSLGATFLEDGKCPCGETIEGVFE